jgi:hypothetical protein
MCSRPSLFVIQRLKVSDGTHVGPHLLEDQLGREKIMHFDHERIPERVVHARGTGAYGYFKVYDDRASKYTYAPVLTDPSRKTPVFVRFSTVQGSRGSAVRAALSISFGAHTMSPVLGHRSRRSRFCDQVLHARRKLGHRRK